MADADYTFRACSVEGCLSKHKSQGLCAKHYMQSKRKGLNHYSAAIAAMSLSQVRRLLCIARSDASTRHG